MFHATCLAPHTAATLRGLGDLGAHAPWRSCTARRYQGDGRKALHELADAYEGLIASAA